MSIKMGCTIIYFIALCVALFTTEKMSALVIVIWASALRVSLAIEGSES